MALLDVSIVNVAIPSMRDGLHTSAGTGMRAALLTGAALVSLALAMAVRSLRPQTAA